jgi:hypothetical protein
MFGTGVLPVTAFGCGRCGHLQLGVKFSEEMLEKHQHFDDSPPPSVTG